MEFRVSLHPGQAAIYNSTARFKVCAAGRRFGKSHLAAVLLGIEALKTHNDAGYELTSEHGVYYVAPTFDQAKRIMWPKLHELLGYQRTGGLIANENTNDGWIELINGRRIYIKGADNPDSLRGIGLSYVVMDEYADMRATVWHEIIRPALMDVEGCALFIGTPKGKNHFYKLFMGALEKPIDPRTGTNAHWQQWEAFHFKSMDNPFLKASEVQSMFDSNMPSDVVKQEIEASFVSGGAKILKPEWFDVVSISPRSGHYVEGPNHVVIGDMHSGTPYITVDLAGFVKTEGKKIARLDETVICITMERGGTWFVEEMQHGQWDPREVAMRIVRACSKYPGARLGIEKGALMNAIGPYLEEYMREFGRYVSPQPLSHGNTKKTDRIQWALQGRAEKGRIKLVDDRDKDPWVDWFLDQCADFPDPLAHDDGLDALAYVDQLASTVYADPSDFQEWQPLDIDSGY